MSSTNLYSRFHDWRARLYQQLADTDTDFLTALRADMARTLEDIERELERRAADAQTKPHGANDDNRTD